MTIVRKFLFLFFGFLIAFCLVLLPSVQKVKKIEKKAKIEIGDQIILADVVLTEREQEKGLSGVMYMKINEGMLFIFKEKKKHVFWMKDMKIPIDIVWINDKRIVGVNEHVMPEPGKDISELTIYMPSEPVDKVLEIRGGRFNLFNVNIGDKIKIDSIIPNQSWAGNLLDATKQIFRLNN